MLVHTDDYDLLGIACTLEVNIREDSKSYKRQVSDRQYVQSKATSAGLTGNKNWVGRNRMVRKFVRLLFTPTSRLRLVCKVLEQYGEIRYILKLNLLFARVYSL